MTAQSQRPLATVLALVLTAAFWIPTLTSPVAAQEPSSAPIVFASSASVVMM
jgi:hypothetical protein